jgi:transposase
MKSPGLNFLSPEERADFLKSHRKERDGKIKDKIKAILLLDKGWSYNQIAEALFLDDQTLRNYKETYDKNKSKGLLETNYKGRISKLSITNKQELEVHLREITYLTSDQIKEYIRSKYGVEYTKKGIISLLHRLGFKYKKPKLVPGNPDVDKQKEFIERYKNIRASLKEGDELLFLDGVHPSHNVRPGFGWIKKGITKQISSNTGRKRININAALNVRKTEVVYREEETINAESTAFLLLNILEKYPKAGTIYVVLDNARYNRSKLVEYLLLVYPH